MSRWPPFKATGRHPTCLAYTADGPVGAGEEVFRFPADPAVAVARLCAILARHPETDPTDTGCK